MNERYRRGFRSSTANTHHPRVVASEARQSNHEKSAQRGLKSSRDSSHRLDCRVACGSSQRLRAENGLVGDNNAASETSGLYLQSVI